MPRRRIIDSSTIQAWLSEARRGNRTAALLTHDRLQVDRSNRLRVTVAERALWRQIEQRPGSQPEP